MCAACDMDLGGGSFKAGSFHRGVQLSADLGCDFYFLYYLLLKGQLVKALSENGVFI